MARWKKGIAQIFRRKENDIEISRQRTVLETVVKDVELRAKLFLGKKAGLVTALTNNDLAGETPRDQKWFITKIRCGSASIDHQRTFCVPAISAGENIERNSALL